MFGLIYSSAFSSVIRSRTRDMTLKRIVKIWVSLFILLLSSLSWATEIRISGVTEPLRDIDLALPVGGTVSSIQVREGETVKQGQTLLRLRSVLEELDVKRMKRVWRFNDKLETARKREALLIRQLEATKRLYDNGRSVSLEEYEVKQFEVLAANLELKQLKTAKALEKIEFDTARERLAQRILQAPSGGVVTLIDVDEGEAVEASRKVMRLVDISKCLFVSAVREEESGGLSLNQKVRLEIRSASGVLQRTGQVSFISPVVDSASGLMEIKVLIDNSDGAIRPGVPATLLL